MDRPQFHLTYKKRLDAPIEIPTQSLSQGLLNKDENSEGYYERAGERDEVFITVAFEDRKRRAAVIRKPAFGRL
jgi:hypothetical protein